MPEAIQRSFSAGEISPSLHSRSDLAKYATALALVENFIIKPQGGAYSRPGTKFIGEGTSNSSKSRFIPFEFNTEQTYILEFSDLSMRVIRDGGYVLDGAGPAIYELTTPFTEADLPGIRYTQDADVMTLAHINYDTRELSRNDHDDWSIAAIDFASPVPAPANTTSTPDDISGITLGATTVITTTANHGLLAGDTITLSGIVGTTELNGVEYTLEGGDTPSSTSIELDIDSTSYTPYVSGGVVAKQSTINISTTGSGFGDYTKKYQYVVTCVDVDGNESNPSLVTSLTSSSLSTTGGIRLQWGAVPNASYYRVYKSPSQDTDVFGWIGDSETLTFSDFNIAPLTSIAPPSDRNPFADSGNKPTAVTYYQQRRIFANTLNEPQAVFTSQTGRTNSMRVSNPSRDDDAITFTLRANKVNEIRHLVPLDSLIALTSGGVWKITEGQDEVLIPSTVGFKRQSNIGASETRPVEVDGTMIYVEDKGTTVRDLNYQFVDDKFSGGDLSILASHLFEDKKIIEMAYCHEPDGILWALRDDGVLLGLTYHREHQVIAWHRHDLGGVVESIASISEDDRDALYISIVRDVNGISQRYTERLEHRDVTSQINSWCVDSGLKYEGSAATVISGLDHLENEEVSVVADGDEVTGLTVTSGQITLPEAASTVLVGLKFTPVLDTLPVDQADSSSLVRSKKAAITDVDVEYESSRGGSIGSIDDDGNANLQELILRQDSDGYDSLPLRTGKTRVNIGPGWNDYGKVRIQQNHPFPLAILSIIPDVTYSG